MERFNNVVTVKGQRFLFHRSIDTELLRTVENKLNTGMGSLKLFNQIYGKMNSDTEKKTRKLVNAIIKAKNNSDNVNKHEIKVKLSDRTIKLRPIIYKR